MPSQTSPTSGARGIGAGKAGDGMIVQRLLITVRANEEIDDDQMRNLAPILQDFGKQVARLTQTVFTHYGLTADWTVEVEEG